MSEQKNSGSQDVITGESTDPESQKELHGTNTLAIQNNNYFVQQIDLVALGKLNAKNPELAEKYMEIMQQQFEHSVNVDDRILSLEEKEQEKRHEDIPYQREYAFRGQIISSVTVVLSLITAGVLGTYGLEKAAIAAITVPIGVIAVNFLGIKNKAQK